MSVFRARLGSGKVIIGEVDIGEVSVASASIFVPFEHGVDRFRQLAATAFIDTARIDPYPRKSITRCLAASAQNLSVPVAICYPRLVVFYKLNFVRAPPMGQDGIRLDCVAVEFTSLEVFGID